MNITLILALYGAIISTVVLLLRFKDRADKKRKLLLRVDKYDKKSNSNEKFIGGRKANQYIRIRITNQSSNPNVLEKVELKSISSFLGFSYGETKIPINFDHDFELPLRLNYSEIASGYIFINMDNLEFYQDKKSNYEILKEVPKKYLYVKAYDTQDKKYYSNKIKIIKLLEEFISKEKDITTDHYFNKKYK